MTRVVDGPPTEPVTRPDGAASQLRKGLRWRKLLGESFGTGFWAFAAAAIVLGAVVYHQTSPETFWDILEADIVFLAETLPRILVALAVAGLVRVMLPTKRITALIGQDSGLRGLIIAGLAGCITPGGPSSSFALLAALGAGGADRGALISYITAWAMLNIQRIFVWDIPFMGEEIALARFLVCLPLPILAGIIARRIPFELKLSERATLHRD